MYNFVIIKSHYYIKYYLIISLDQINGKFLYPIIAY